MIRKNKLLICALAMSMILTVLPGMTSNAAESDGEAQAAETELQDENSQRLEEVTAMEEDGSIVEISDTDGTVAEDETGGIALFAVRSISPKVVNFNTKGSATTSYNNGAGYTNGAYGADAAYLGTANDGSIRFMLAGVTGTVSASEVQLVDYDSVADNVSYYAVSDGKLIHYISQNVNNAPSSSINNGPAPSYLSEGVKYYSYDGHYFYTDYYKMLSDYQTGAKRDSSVNPDNAFYNYFQFLDMRSSTKYSGDELNSILKTAMANVGINAGSSKLTGTGTSFVENQNTYGVNALLSMGIAINESGWGTSWICMNKNNIFGLNAVDSAPGTSADSFASVDDCIRDFMKNWMAGGYLDSSDWRNHGEYLGDKGGGINVSYASDPYWGEKAAALAWNLDAIGGNKDYPATGSDVTETPDSTPGTDNDTPEGDNSAPDDSVTVPDNTTPEPDDSVTVPDNTTPEPDDSVTVPDTTTPEPDDSVTVPDNTTPEPDDSVTVPDTTTPEPDDSVTVPDNTTPEPDDSVTVPDNTVPETDSVTSGADDTTSEEENNKSDEVTAPENSTANNGADSGTKVTVNNNSQGASVTAPAAVTKTASPKTGDSANTAVWVALAGLSAILMIAALAKRKTAR